MNSKVIRWGLIALSFLIAGCQSLPSLEGRTQSVAYSKEQVADTYFAKALTPIEEQHGAGKSGIYPLVEADEAFSARMMLAKYAQRSLDVQYYIWRRDMTGTMLYEALHAAADRGVRVRLLLDDNNTNGSDPILSALHGHENIEVRLFNPFMLRKLRWWGFVTDFSRLNRRMHNKSFIADNSVSIIGGRNIGDEYFGATDDVLFADLDILSVGAAVQDVSDDFDKYWHSASSYPLDRVVRNTSMSLTELRQQAATISSSAGAQKYIEYLRESAFITQLEHRDIDFEWLEVRMVSDDPRKGLGLAKKESLLIQQFQDIIGDPTVDVELVSPYFVPTEAGVEAFAWLVSRGVEVKVLTNSLSATDVAVVHAGYAKRRKALLESGVTLYEMQRHPAQTKPVKRKKRFLGSSGSSLHAKTFSVDQKHVFVGSFNFDPRSANLNTELGFVIESPRLAKRINQAFYDEIPAHAYHVKLTESGRMYWTEQRDVGIQTYTSEPNSSVWRRMTTHMLSWLPIEGLL